MPVELKALPVDSRLLYELISSVMDADDIDDVIIRKEMMSRFNAIADALIDEFKAGNKVGERIRREARRVKLTELIVACESNAELAGRLETLHKS